MSVSCVKIEPDNEVDNILYENFTHNYRKGWIEVGEGDDKCCMPENYKTIADKIENFKVKDTDIFITTHPKTGTTWAQEMIWMIVNKLDFERGKIELYDRSPFLEFQGIVDYNDDYFTEMRENMPDFLVKSIEVTKNYPTEPRIIKTHMPFTLLPKQIRDKTKKPKIIHVVRNPKDTCVSYYYHCRLLEGFKGNMDDFCKLFLAGRVPWGPFFKNILVYWNRRQEYDILYLKYEDMKKDLKSVIMQVSEYLDYSLTSDQVSQLLDHLSFKNMKQNNSLNQEEFCVMTRQLNNVEGEFMRSGTVGSYKADMSPEMISRFNKWTEKNTAGTGLSFDE